MVSSLTLGTMLHNLVRSSVPCPIFASHCFSWPSLDLSCLILVYSILVAGFHA